MADNGEVWISAWEAIKLLKLVMDQYSAQITICARAHDKLISAQAVRLVVEDHRWRNAKIKEENDVEVPPEFWWARGDQALTQNWSAGDFETWIGKEVLCKAYGVKFLRSDIMSMVPPDAQKRATDTQAKKGKKIFIGHGHSLVWRELKDFIVGTLNLPCDEFNAVPSAGIPTVVRLKQMLDDAAFAFLVLTAEDERKDGKIQPRMNVVHEAGLFQGRLGFEKAIIVLEEGCEKILKH
jgi:hypothetical protein